MIIFDDHAGFHRGALAVVGAGSAGALAAYFLDLSSGRPLLAGALALALARSVGGAVSARRRVLAAAAAAAAVVAAFVCGDALAPGFLLGAPRAGELLLAPVISLVAVLGLLPLHLTVSLRRDPVGRALASAGQDLGPAAVALCQRARAAEARIQQALASERVPDARALRRLARALALGALELGRKERLLAQAATAGGAGAIVQRLMALAAERAATADEGAARQYDAALTALREQQAHLAAIAGSADRLRAHLHGQVALLEGTALALAARRGALAADEAAALAPLVERLREVSAHARAEAAALASL
jgi:hypothetical protein